MPQRHLHHEFALAAAPRAVAEHLAEPTNYVGLSPLVVEVRDIRRDGSSSRYTAIERFPLPFGGHLDNAIDVTLSLDDSDPALFAVGGDVVSPGWVRMRYEYRVRTDAAGSHVTDHLHLRAPFGLVRFAAGRARAVQLARAEVLATRLERSGSA